MQEKRIARATLGLPKQRTSGDAFTRLCAPLLNKKVLATHKASFLIRGLLVEADNGVLSLTGVEIVSKARKVGGILNLIININVLSHIHEDLGDV